MTKTAADYDTVHRVSETTFTGVPIARLKRGHWYWPDYETARDFAVAFDLPKDRIIPHKPGWAIQLYKSGPYIDAPHST